MRKISEFFYLKTSGFLVKVSIYLNRRVFVMRQVIKRKCPNTLDKQGNDSF